MRARRDGTGSEFRLFQDEDGGFRSGPSPRHLAGAQGTGISRSMRQFADRLASV